MDDQAGVISKILLSPEENIGKVYPLYCETFAEITEEIGKLIGKRSGKLLQNRHCS